MPLRKKTKGVSILRSGIFLFLFLFSFYSFSNPASQKEYLPKKYNPNYAGNPPSHPENEVVSKGPQTELDSLERYKVSPKDNPLAVALKADDMLSSLQHPLEQMDENPSIQTSQTKDMMEMADKFSSSATNTSNQVHEIYSEIASMMQRVKSNFESFNKSGQSETEANKLNNQSDIMADRVAALHSSFAGLSMHVKANQAEMEGMLTGLDEKAHQGKAAISYYDQLSRHVKDVSSRFEEMASIIKSQGLDAPGAFGEARAFLSSFQKYVEGHKPYTNNQIKFTQDVKNYLHKTQDYLGKVASNFDKIDSDLLQAEDYFRNAKVRAPRGANPLDLNPKEAPDACAGVIADDEKGNKAIKKHKPLSTLQSCQKTCHSVCRQKAKAADGQGCFECPSGSPDTCYDIGALPADVSWCKAGGICHDDPELHCVPFGAYGPNKMPLNCTNCQQWPDECWQKVGQDTTNLTHCEQTCAGECVYAGKYKNLEWDNTPEYMHCYRCKMPPGPPSCEDLGWGSTTPQMCMKDCKDGECKKVTITIGKDGKPAIDDGKGKGGNNGPGGNQGGGNDQGNNGQGENGKGEGGQDKPLGGDQTGGGGIAGGDQGNKPNPPTDKPLGGDTGGGGTVAGGETKGDEGKSTGANQPNGPQTTNQKPPEAPVTTEPKKPDAPSTQDKPKPPDDKLPPPPDNPDIQFWKKMIEETKDRIKSRDDIINDPNEYQSVKDLAKEQKEGMIKTKERLEKNLNDAQDKERQRIKEEEDAKKQAEEYRKTQPKSVDYAKEAEKRGQTWKLNKLKEATNALKTKVKEAKESLENRRKRIDDMTKEIDHLTKENEYFTKAIDEDRIDKDFAKTRVKENEEKIAQLTKDRDYYIKELKKAQKRYEDEIERLKSEYRTALWRVDENARRKAEVERIDEYYERERELKRREEMRELRNQTFDKIANDLENAKKDAETRGDSNEAEKLQQQIDNLKREQADWNESLERQEQHIKDQMYEMERRNFDEGAGPWSEKSLGEKLDQYANILETKLKDPSLTTDQKAAIQATLDGIKEKQDYLKNPQLTDTEKQTVVETTTKVANAAMDKNPDKSFIRLAGESILEEGVHNLNPYVAAKKSLAFGWGVVQGVGTAVKGAADLVATGDKLIVQAIGSDLGFEGVFGTDALDKLNSVLSTGSNNANFDGLLKAVVAAGGALDAKITELEKSGDIDWATANFGGQVAGEYVVAPELAEVGIGKMLGTGADALEAGNTATKTVDVTDAGNAATKTADLTEGANAGSKAEATVAKGAEPVAENPVQAPTSESKAPQAPVGEGTQARAPPENGPATPATKPVETSAPVDNGPATPATKAGEAPQANPATPATKVGESAPATPSNTLGENKTLTFKDTNGQPVTIKTGEQLGQGSTSTVYVDATDPSKAIRVTTAGPEAAVPEATKLDEAGRKAVESIQKPDGPIRIVAKGERYTVNDPTSPLNGKTVEVVERVQNGSADKFLAKQGGQMTDGQAAAFDQATRELNKNGYAWMDNHTGNYGFEKVPGTDDQWKVVVLDPGGIVPAKGATLAEKAENAAIIQKRLNVPTDETTSLMEFAKNKPKGIQKMIWSDIRGQILEDVGSKIDAEAIGLSGPEEVGFYPAGTYEFKNVQDLAGLSSQEAAAKYAVKK